MSNLALEEITQEEVKKVKPSKLKIPEGKVSVTYFSKFLDSIGIDIKELNLPNLEDNPKDIFSYNKWFALEVTQVKGRKVLSGHYHFQPYSKATGTLFKSKQANYILIDLE